MAKTIPGLCVPAEALTLGVLGNNIYILGGPEVGATVVVDPGCRPEPILEALDGRTLDFIVLTHCHWDHVAGAAALREATGAQVVASAIDAPVIEGEQELVLLRTAFDPCPVDRKLDDGDVLRMGAMEWQVILTPGHTKGGICLFLDSGHGPDPSGMPILIAGDTLFSGTIGRTDLDGGSMDDMRTSLAKLAKLPDETAVLTGHGDLTTIGSERQRVLEFFMR